MHPHPGYSEGADKLVDYVARLMWAERMRFGMASGIEPEPFVPVAERCNAIEEARIAVQAVRNFDKRIREDETT